MSIVLSNASTKLQKLGFTKDLCTEKFLDWYSTTQEIQVIGVTTIQEVLKKVFAFFIPRMYDRY